ncbi:MAG: TonB-dependent receptor [Candidatus Omnitrophica bacterium]|nr:TonB-dependent receptor [Candidatus Omnitrophota bacterium]
MGNIWARAGVAIALVMAAPAALANAESAEPTRRLMTPRRIPGLMTDERTVPANVTVLTSKELEGSGVATVEDALQKVEGVTVLSTTGFGLGADGSVNLRGVVNSSRSNVLVLVDGVRQNRISGDEVHWQSIPVEDIERIEIVRGGGGMMYGEGAFAGVINILTKQSSDTPLETEQGVEFGSFGWQQYHLAARGRSDRFTYGTSYHRRLLTGYREFSQSRNTTVTSHLGIEMHPAATLQLHVLHSEDTTAFPGGLTPAQAEYRRRQADMSRVGIFDDQTDQVSADLILGPWEGLSGAANVFWRNRNVDSLMSGLFTLAPSRGLSLRGNYEWGDDALRSTVISGIELTDDKATIGTRGSPFGPADESNRSGYGLYAENTTTLNQRLSLVSGLRYDRFRYTEAMSFPAFEGTLRFEGFSPKVGTRYAVLPGVWDVFASYSRPFKAPSVDDFSAQVAQFAGNVDLRPQQADTYEVGTRITPGPVEAGITGFYLKTQDEILFNRVAFQNQNYDTRRLGAEMSVRASSAHARGYTSYTVVDASFHKGAFDGNRIPGTPAQQLSAGVGVSPLPGWWVDLDWQLVNDFYLINDFNNALPKADNYGVLNLTLAYERSWGRAFLTFYNVTNEEYVSFQSSNATDLSGAGENPMPPLHVVAGIRTKF